MRTLISTVLIVLLTVLTPLSAIAAWTDLEIGDSDRFVATTVPLASDPAVRNAVSDRVTDEVMKRIDAGAMEDQVRDLLHSAVLSFTTTDAFKTAWTMVSRAVQNTTERALTSDNDNPVTIDLATVTGEAKRRLGADGVPFADRIPVRHTEITVLRPADLGARIDVVRGLRAAGIWPAVGSLALAAVAVLLPAARYRRRAVLGVGLALAVGAGLLFLCVWAGRGLTLDNLPSGTDRSAAEAVYDALTGSLRTAAWAVLAAGVALAAAAAPWGRIRRPGQSGRPGRPGRRHIRRLSSGVSRGVSRGFTKSL
ncbi:hypothetical protein [Streptomyces sp. 150FB]|uniref:hypothetical protein n=1 Tax=Streptomyces sp. 150FB TaxID=1576605 RepID=UPI000ACFEF19|nr:hypothetical protein [Streptomyces sp. 150FB]